MKYFTTLEVAHKLKVSKQTLLNWLYSGKVPEPPRDKKGYRMWSPARVRLVKRLIGDGRLHKRTVVHREAGTGNFEARDYAREVQQFLRDARLDPEAFLTELARINRVVANRLRVGRKA